MEEDGTYDVTSLVEFTSVDDESLPLVRCVCGHKFENWSFILSVYKDSPTACPYCDRKFYFTNSVRIIEVIDDLP